MAESLGTAVLELDTDNSKLNKGLSDGEGKSKKSFGKMGAFAKVGFGAAAVGVGVVLKSLADDFIADEKAAKQTEAVIKSTGGAAGVTAKHVEKLSDSIRNKSGIDDAAISTGQNMLLTFTNIKNEVGKGKDVFDQTTKTMADMSAAMGTDMKGQAIQLGKALNDPIAGVGALAEVGVTFTKEQKASIKAMQESGDMAGAQGVILKELQKEFGGSAKAAGETFGGGLNILKGQLMDAAAPLMKKLMPALSDLVKWVTANLPIFIAHVKVAFEAVQKYWEENLRPTFDKIMALMGFLLDAVVSVWPQIRAVIEAAMKIIQGIVQTVTSLISGDWSAAWDGIKQIFSGIWDGIQAIIKLQIALFLALFSGLLSSLWQKITDAKDAIVNAAKGLATGIVNGIINLVTGIAGKVGGLIAAIPGAILGYLTEVGTEAGKLGAKIVSSIVGTVTGIGGDVKELIGKIPGKLGELVDNVTEAGKKLGVAIFNGLKSGIGDIGSFVGGLVVGIVNRIIDFINGMRLPKVEVDTHIPGIGKVGIGPIDFPNLGHVALAEGGIVTRPTMALLGEKGREAVIPLDRMPTGDVHLHFENTLQNADAVQVGHVTSHMLKNLRK